jgi:DNA-binding transcriptional MerR regulator
MAVPARAYLSIGEVLTRLRTEFTDITISKIRFLESEGLIEPQRTPSGYRKFTTNDLERLRFVLLAQRDQYLPLKVIKENLDAMDRGLTPAKAVGGVATPRLAAADGVLTADQFASDNDLRLTRAEMLSASNLTDEQLTEIESYGLVAIRGRHYDSDGLAVAKAVAEISAFGIGARRGCRVASTLGRDAGGWVDRQSVVDLVHHAGDLPAA